MVTFAETLFLFVCERRELIKRFQQQKEITRKERYKRERQNLALFQFHVEVPTDHAGEFRMRVPRDKFDLFHEESIITRERERGRC